MSAIRMIAWADTGQEALVRDVADGGGFELAAVGPELRTEILRDDGDVLWLATRHRIEADERRLVREATRPTFSSEPLPGSAADVLADPHEAATARFVPLMRHSPGFRAAAEVFEPFGPRHSANAVLLGAPEHGSLFARLFDCLDLLETVCGPAEMLDAASYSSAAGAPETLGALDGHLTLNVRFPDQRCASGTVSNRAGQWLRHLIVLGEGGCLRIGDDHFEWVSPEGRLIDSHRQEHAPGPGRLVAMQIRRVLEGAEATDPPPDNARLLALCEAARLSAKTGQGEAPRKMLEMLRRP